jgi:hypothetical protein
MLKQKTSKKITKDKNQNAEDDYKSTTQSHGDLAVSLPKVGEIMTIIGANSHNIFPMQANIANKPPSHPYYTDAIYKMAKKIAQLTKVIYFLNAKHENHQKEIADLENSYTNDINRNNQVHLTALQKAEDALQLAKMHHESEKNHLIQVSKCGVIKQTFNFGKERLVQELQDQIAQLQKEKEQVEVSLTNRHLNEVIKINL